MLCLDRYCPSISYTVTNGKLIYNMVYQHSFNPEGLRKRDVLRLAFSEVEQCLSRQLQVLLYDTLYYSIFCVYDEEIGINKPFHSN